MLDPTKNGVYCDLYFHLTTNTSARYTRFEGIFWWFDHFRHQFFKGTFVLFFFVKTAAKTGPFLCIRLFWVPPCEFFLLRKCVTLGEVFGESSAFKVKQCQEKAQLALASTPAVTRMQFGSADWVKEPWMIPNPPESETLRCFSIENPKASSSLHLTRGRSLPDVLATRSLVPNQGMEAKIDWKSDGWNQFFPCWAPVEKGFRLLKQRKGPANLRTTLSAFHSKHGSLKGYR